MSQVNEPRFDWSALVQVQVHPTRVAVIEALQWIDQPLAAVELRESFDIKKLSTSHIAYHLAVLARAGVIVKVGEQRVRGATKKSYFFSD